MVWKIMLLLAEEPSIQKAWKAFFNTGPSVIPYWIITRMFKLNFMFKAYATFGARKEDFKPLIRVAINNLLASPLIARLTAKPRVELAAKIQNEILNGQKTDDLAIASRVKKEANHAGAAQLSLEQAVQQQAEPLQIAENEYVQIQDAHSALVVMEEDQPQRAQAAAGTKAPARL
ncbi:hypothetical protein SMACR_09629 [Sordaria macrospora]|uniref:WGS project CABT00000000 data, contig 2.130 n=2 Tax=Sordaria macrospora TaxID=5147 RepID=F7WCG6_SORMK|nr:uncharacterized protein SMAC_09629 [Sordaria macrospora k-hell]KAA8622137.1 hypothetical protein SMACR_09629 [Sordaria macrospora]CCC14598.1 unnamed protein product [Sordaria macrospora k-hell]